MRQNLAELEKLRDDMNTQLVCVKDTITLLDSKSVEKDEELKQKNKQLDEMYEESVGNEQVMILVILLTLV